VNNRVKTPFSGGTGVIQDGLLTPKEVRDAGYLCLAASIFAFVLVGWRAGWMLTALAAVGLFSGWSYTAPPLRWSYRGLGEILIGVNCGPVAVLAGYFAMTGRLSTDAIWAGAVMGLWTMAIITINQIPDCEADSRAGKRNLVVRFGCERGLQLWEFWIDLSFATLAAGIFLGRLPAELVLGLLLFPWAERLSIRSRGALTDLPTLTAACGDTIKGETIYWALLVAGAAAARLTGPGL
jgi:1,4-dihydroxy-2-naphthoate octaprenyltransferase